MGLWHDLGKYSNEFQRRLRGESISVEHAGVGARLAYEQWKDKSLPLALTIAGHHAGLPNLQTTETGLPRDLRSRLKQNESILCRCRQYIPEDIVKMPLPAMPYTLAGHADLTPFEKENLRYATEMWIRFLFSCLVDADRQDSARFCDPERERNRNSYASIETLRGACDAYIDQKIASLTPSGKQHRVNKVRLSILAQCRKAAKHATGIFSLTVPTGGGKTLSGMSFALNHAVQNGLQRVIVVIPYTSIIEQNAAVYRQCLGIENVLEHHANLDPEKEADTKNPEILAKHEMAMENWDAPVIVTTTVQFFETLFTATPSKARKLHNIAGSVIILDEVQTLPPGMLNPILDGLKQLPAFYSCSIVLSTATPPALSVRERFEQGLPGAVPIIEDAANLSKKLKRVDIHWPEGSNGLSPEELAEGLSGYEKVLCVVDRRKDARQLSQILKEATGEPVFHLSALMCPAHRLETIERIQFALKEKHPCRVVSTQLIEAGVDLDFPVVYRAMAGLDSIVQAAGRCNREGKADIGTVIVFKGESRPPPGVPRKAADIMAGLLREYENNIDADDPAVFEYYFRQLYFHSATDVKNIQANRRAFNFASVGRDFKLIEDNFTYTVVVPWGDAEQRLAALRRAIDHDLPRKNHLRALQPYTANIYRHAFQNLYLAGALEEIVDGIYTLAHTHKYLYDESYGLKDGDETPAADPESLIVGP